MASTFTDLDHFTVTSNPEFVSYIYNFSFWMLD